MAYQLTINSISPTPVEQKSGVKLVINFTLSGSGIVLRQGTTIDLYSNSISGLLVKTLFDDSTHDLVSGDYVIVSFADVSPGTYYIDVFYKVQAKSRIAITVGGEAVEEPGVKKITLNGTTVTTNSLNGVAITSETLNGIKVYE